MADIKMTPAKSLLLSVLLLFSYGSLVLGASIEEGASSLSAEDREAKGCQCLVSAKHVKPCPEFEVEIASKPETRKHLSSELDESYEPPALKCVPIDCKQECNLQSQVQTLSVEGYYGRSVVKTMKKFFCERSPGDGNGSPKFQGFDGSVFWFYGQRDKSWCISSDKDLHINAYFNGKDASELPPDALASEGSKSKRPHDLTWVQKLAFLFGKHTLIVEAIQESGWTETLDHLAVSFDGEEVHLPPFLSKLRPPDKSWMSVPDASHRVRLTRTSTKNQLNVEIEDLVSVIIKVVPTNPSVWTKTNSFVHIAAEYSFVKFTPDINGILGRTLRSGNTHITGGQAEKTSYVLWDLDQYSTTDIARSDCKVSQFAPSAKAYA